MSTQAKALQSCTISMHPWLLTTLRLDASSQCGPPTADSAAHSCRVACR